MKYKHIVAKYEYIPAKNVNMNQDIRICQFEGELEFDVRVDEISTDRDMKYSVVYEYHDLEGTFTFMDDDGDELFECSDFGFIMRDKKGYEKIVQKVGEDFIG